MTRKLAVGISTCPNDTFLFHPLMSGAVCCEGVELSFELADVEQLNLGGLEGRFDVFKASFHAALALADEHVVLPTGSALGHGVGPVVLRDPERPLPPPAERRVLCPGRWTTAHLLWRLFHPAEQRVEQRVFSEIVPALQAGEADLGVCIHEGRFTWQERGLACVEDLGETWHAQAGGAALPLGGILARRALGPELLGALQEALSRSLAWSRAHPEACLESMRLHAQEQADAVLWQHVELYVNAWTSELGATGREALARLSELARAAELVPRGVALEVFSPQS